MDGAKEGEVVGTGRCEMRDARVDGAGPRAVWRLLYHGQAFGARPAETLAGSLSLGRAGWVQGPAGMRKVARLDSAWVGLPRQSVA